MLNKPIPHLSPPETLSGCTLSLSVMGDVEGRSLADLFPPLLYFSAAAHNSSAWPGELRPEPVPPGPRRSPLSAPIMVNGPGALSGPAAFLIHR